MPASVREPVGPAGERRVASALVLSHGSRDHLPNNPLVFDADATASFHVQAGQLPVRRRVGPRHQQRHQRRYTYKGILTRGDDDVPGSDY